VPGFVDIPFFHQETDTLNDHLADGKPPTVVGPYSGTYSGAVKEVLRKLGLGMVGVLSYDYPLIRVVFHRTTFRQRHIS
jgi:hypothetical protein